MNYLKNPVIVGVSVCAIIMAYLYYKRTQDIKQDKSVEKKPFNYITPLAIGIIVWFVMETLISKNIIQHHADPLPVPVIAPILSVPILSSQPQLPASVSTAAVPTVDVQTNPVLNGGFGDTIETDGMNTYNIISKGNVKLPSMDVFIDLANF